MALGESAREPLLQRLVGRRRTDRLQPVDHQHHRLEVARMDGHVQRRAPRQAHRAIRSVQHIGATLQHERHQPGPALGARPMQGHEPALQARVEVSVRRGEQLRGEWPAGGFDHLLGFPGGHLGCEAIVG